LTLKKRDADPMTLPLCDTAIEILSEIKKGKTDFVFPSRANSATHLSGFSKGKSGLMSFAVAVTLKEIFSGKRTGFRMTSGELLNQSWKKISMRGVRSSRP
jgi:hypothetical protein